MIYDISRDNFFAIEVRLLRRTLDIQHLEQRIAQFPVTALLGARQCGKTTLAREFRADHYFDLESPRDLARLDNPQLALEGLQGLIAIDEIQRAPDLFPLLRHLVDTHPDQKYLILGSASRDLIRQGSESLAGRIAFYQLGGFRLDDVGADQLRKLWLRGSFPRSFLAASDEESYQWRDSYVSTFLERDIPQLGIAIPARTLRRFWTMLSHYHGQVVNYAEFARSFGVSDMTIRRYLDILAGTFMVRVLQPWHVNIGKRLVKSPKIYLRDSGIFHTLQSISSRDQLLSHNKLGASWEGFALECACQAIDKGDQERYYWRTHAGAEVDLFWQEQGRNWAIEFKFADAPRLTKSMQSAVKDLGLERLWVVYPGGEQYRMAENITALPLEILARQKAPWRN
jgi:predicted AAA+ superfamily ATPase